MNIKRIAALATLGALISTVGPAIAANPTQNITVKWNTQQLATILVTTQASAAQTRNGAGEEVYWASNPAGSLTSGCAGTVATASAGLDTTGANTVDFGNVSIDTAKVTECLEVNAASVYVVTNDANGYNVGVQASAGTPAAYNTTGGPAVCTFVNGTDVNNAPYAASARVAAVTEASPTTATPCSAGISVPTAANLTNLLAATGAGNSTTGTDLNTDMELVEPANAASGAVIATFTYTLGLN
jgi:hypothetical protein